VTMKIHEDAVET